jgi:diguanylate cyclase (GGDEF)-like protein
MRHDQLVTVLARFATTFAWGASTREGLEHVATQLGELLPVAGIGLLLVEDQGSRHLVASEDVRIRCVEGLPVALGEGPCLFVLDTGRHLAVPDLAADRLVPAFAGPAVAAGIGAVFAFPLRHAGVRIGAIELYADHPVVLSRADLQGAQVLADVVGSYVLIAKGREAAIAEAARLSRDALHDPLTSLPNRRLLRDRLAQAAKRAERTGRGYGIVTCDVDDLEEVNVRHGYLIGDRLLVELAERIGATLRPEDTLARVSGDEFVIVCEEVDDDAELERVVARTRKAVRAPFHLEGGGSTVRTSLSLGSALASPHRGSGQQALEHADAARYRAKRKARAPQLTVVPPLDDAALARRVAD